VARVVTTSAKNETWRVFCAIELPATLRARVMSHVAKLKQSAPDARASWARDTNLHLTLKFLGNIPTTSVSKLSEAAARAVSEFPTFSLRFETTGAFPNQRQARVLWIGVNDISRKLHELQERLEEHAALAGFSKETRKFSPHLTIARLRNLQDGRTLAAVHSQLEFAPVEMMVSELLVIRSELSSSGSKYSVISRHQLSGD
jgi:2'-5' RNA ligase